MSESLWPVDVTYGSTTRTLWFAPSELVKARVSVTVGGTLLRAGDFKNLLRCFEDPNGCKPLVLRGAWIHETGKLTCDRVERG